MGSSLDLWPYLITFELTDLDRHAPALSAILGDLGGVRLTNQAWLIASDWNASAILEQLRPIVGEGDRLLVVELGEDLAGWNVAQTVITDEAAPRYTSTPVLKVN